MATINDIEKMAGVSVSTVSHVVNKTRYVSFEKVEKVERAIRRSLKWRDSPGYCRRAIGWQAC